MTHPFSSGSLLALSVVGLICATRSLFGSRAGLEMGSPEWRGRISSMYPGIISALNTGMSPVEIARRYGISLTYARQIAEAVSHRYRAHLSGEEIWLQATERRYPGLLGLIRSRASTKRIASLLGLPEETIRRVAERANANVSREKEAEPVQENVVKAPVEAVSSLGIARQPKDAWRVATERKYPGMFILMERGESYLNISATYGLTASTVAEIAKKAGIKRQAKDYSNDERVIELVGLGLSDPEIGRRIGVSYRVVEGIRKRLGLPRGNKSAPRSMEPA